METLKIEEIRHNLVVININKSFIKESSSVYECVKAKWILNQKRLQQIEYVAAEYKGVIIGIFRPDRWIKYDDSRMGFEGVEVTNPSILTLYMNKKLEKMKGQANPVRYFLQ